MSGGFVMFPEWLRAKRPSPNVYVAYVTLGSFGTFNPRTGRYDECRPSMQRMCDESGLSESAMKRAIADLIEIGGAIRHRRQNRNGSSAPSSYELVFGEVREPRPESPVLEGSTSGPLGGQERTSGGPPADPNQEPSTQNQKTKIEKTCGASSSSSTPTSDSNREDDDDARTNDDLSARREAKSASTGKRLTARQRDEQRARSIIIDCGSNRYDSATCLIKDLRDGGVKLVGAYLAGVVEQDGEDKVASMVEDSEIKYFEWIDTQEQRRTVSADGIATQIKDMRPAMKPASLDRIRDAYAEALRRGWHGDQLVDAVNGVLRSPRSNGADAYVEALTALGVRIAA